MSVRYHINPERGPLVCHATSPERCLYGASAKHYSSLEEAERAWQSELSSRYGSLSSVRRRIAAKDGFEDMADEEIQSFVNVSEENYHMAEDILLDRASETRDWRSALDSVNPYEKGAPFVRQCDKETYSSLMRDFNSYRDRTAFIVESLNESRFFKPLYVKRDFSRIGRARLMLNEEPNSTEWVRHRADAMGGSDVGILAMRDFVAPAYRPFYADKAFEKMKHMKEAGATDDDVAESKRNAFGKVGAMYRGTVWEDRIRNDFAKDHADEFSVVEAKGQYVNVDRDWQRVNLDGVLLRKDSENPSEILEIKTASTGKGWENGSIPLSYRAQTLYYLNATGLERVRFRVLVNDSESFERVIEHDDEVAEGSGVTMESYIRDKVEPWFGRRLQERKR